MSIVRLGGLRFVVIVINPFVLRVHLNIVHLRIVMHGAVKHSCSVPEASGKIVITRFEL